MTRTIAAATQLAVIMARANAIAPAARDTIELIKLGARHCKLAEHACNRELTERELRQAPKIEERIIALAAEYGATVIFGGDPRGFTVRLHFGPDIKREPSNNIGGGWGI